MKNLPLPNKLFSSGSFSFRFMVLYLAKTIPMLIQFLTAWYYSNKLTLDDYGIYQSCWVFIAVLSITGTFGLPVMMLNRNYSHAFAEIPKGNTKIILLLLLAQLAGAVYLYASNQYLGTASFSFLLLIILFQSASLVFETMCISSEKQGTVLWINLIYAVVIAGWHYYVVQSMYDLEKLLTGVVIITGVKMVLYILFIPKGLFTASPGFNKSLFNREWYLLGANEVLGVLAKWIDKVVVFFLFSSADFAYYFNGAYEIPVFGMLVSVAGNMLVVSFSKSSVSKDESVQLFRKVTLMLSNIVFPAFAALLFFHKELFAVLFKTKFDDSIPVFIISLMVLPVRICYYTAILQTENKSRLIVLGSLIDILVFLVLSSILFPVWGKLMIPLSLVLATYIQAGFYLYHTSKLIKEPVHHFFPFDTLLWKMLLCVVVTGGIYYLLPDYNAWLKLFTGAAIAVTLSAVLITGEIRKPKQG